MAERPEPPPSGPLGAAGAALPRGARSGRLAPRQFGIATLAVLCMTLASCAADNADAPERRVTDARLALPEDPVWQWLNDSGAVALWEARHSVSLSVIRSFDQFASFSGGHADVALVNAVDVPLLVEQFDREAVIIGKVLTDRSFLAADRTVRAESLLDMIETRLAVHHQFGSTLVWAVIADELHGLDFHADSPDFDLVKVEATEMAALLDAGDVEGCLCLPERSAAALRSRRLDPLFAVEPDDAAARVEQPMSTAQVYAREVLGGSDTRLLGEVLIADGDWYSRNPAVVDRLLELWDSGLRDWEQNKATRVAAYPHLFTAGSQSEIDWIIEYVHSQPWYEPTVYISESEERVYADILGRLRALGLLAADAAAPLIHTVQPAPVPAS